MKSFVKILRKWWLPWLLLGLFFRLIIAAITIHPDIWALNFSSYLFAFRGVGNIYDYLASLPPSSEWFKLYGPTLFTYPPLAYFLLGSFMFLLGPLINHPFLEWFSNHSISASLGNPDLFGHLLLLKLPYLLFDLGVAFLLMGLFKEEDKKKKAFLLWIFSPISFYTSFMVGQFDILPVFFLILALYLVARGKSSLAVISVGIGGSLKLFPLLLLPFFVFVSSNIAKDRIKLAILGLLPYLLTILPFLSSPAFRQTVLFSNQSQKMLFMGLPASGAEVIYVFVVGLVFLWFLASNDRLGMNNLWRYGLVALLLFFSVTHYHPQWFLWLAPFLVLELVKNNFVNKWLVLLLSGCWLLLLFFFEPSLWKGLFSPVAPVLAESFDISSVLPAEMNVFQIKSLIRSVFAATSFVLIFLTLKKS